MTSSANISSIYTASDIMTFDRSLLNSSQRSTAINNYIIFVQMGVIGEVLREVGNPAATGKQQTALTYSADGIANDNISNGDACALTAAMAIIADSYSNSELSDSDSLAVTTSITSICTDAGVDCSALNKDRTACDGGAADPESIAAAALITQINNTWTD